MISRLIALLFLITLQACQVSEKVTGSTQTANSNQTSSEFSVTLPPDGWKKLGDVITISLNYPYEILVSGSPSINVQIGSTTRQFVYQSGSGTNTIHFNYTVTSLDEDTDGIDISHSVSLNGGTIGSNNTSGLFTNIPTLISIPANVIKVDGVIPTLKSMTAPNSGLYYTGQYLNYSMAFSEPVYATGNVGFKINFTTGQVQAVVNAGSGTKNLEFRYQLLASDIDSNGFNTGTLLNLNPSLGIAITDEAGNSPSATLPLLSANSRYRDLQGASIKSISPSGTTHATGENVDFTLSFQKPLIVSNNSRVMINLASGSIHANYLSGTGTKDVVFRYTVQTGSEAFYGITLSSLFELTSIDSLFINVAGPTITTVSAPIGATYLLGQNLDFTVNLTAPVNVTGTPVIPITLTTGTTSAKYLSGSGTSALIFRYQVLLNEQDLDGISLGSPILASGGTIKNLLGTLPAVLTYTPPSTPTVKVNSVIGPYIISSTGPSFAVYKEGQNLDFSLKFNTAVSVSGGTPQLPINLGSGIVLADYQPALSTPTNLIFRYQVQVGDSDLDGITITSPIALNGATIQDASLLNATLAYIGPNTGGVKVDGSFPAITNVFSPAAATYIFNQNMIVNVTFSETVTISGTPKLNLTIGSTPVVATYLSGSGTSALSFKYTITSGQEDLNGISISSPMDLSVGSISDLNGHALSVLTFTPPVTTSVLVDAKAPIILSVTAPTASSYVLGSSLNFVVNWNENVSISGTPRLVLNIQGTTVFANYSPIGSTPTASLFRYIVGADLSDTSITISSPINMTNGSIADMMGNNAAPAAFTLPSLAGVIIDGVKPKVISVTKPADRTYKAGEALNFTLGFSKAVFITGNPKIKIKIGVTDIHLDYLSGSGTALIVFSYTLQPGDLDLNGIDLYSTIYLTGADKIRDAAALPSNDADLSFVVPILMNVLVDSVAPTIVSITPPPNETYNLNQYLYFTVHWSEPVLITGTPRLMLLIDSTSFGPAVKYATYDASTSTSLTTVFLYQVVSNDLDSNGILINPLINLSIGGSSIKDFAGPGVGNGNLANLNFSMPTLTNVRVDGVKPVITSITSPAAGNYTAGMSINITVNWSEVMTVVGSPWIKIKIGANDRLAFYSSGSPSNALVFSYIVTASDEDYTGLDIYSPINVTVADSIQDAAPNNGVLTFTAPPTLTGVIVDGKPPVITSTYTTSQAYKPGNVIEYVVTYHETVKVVNQPRLVLNIGGETRYATYYTGHNTNTLRFQYTVDASNVVLDLDGIAVTQTIDMNGTGSIKDVIGYDAVTPLGFTEIDYVHYSNMKARYHVSGTDYNTTPCAGGNCLYGTTDAAPALKNIAGTGTAYNIKSVSPIGPRVEATGFGDNSTGYMQFNNSSFVNLPNTSSIRFMFFVVKTPSDASNSSSTSYHTLISRKIGTAVSPTIRYESSSTVKAVYKSFFGYFQQNADALLGPSSSHSVPWLPDTEYIHKIKPWPFTSYNQNFSPSTTTTHRLGNSDFNGQIAEVIFLDSSSSLTEVQLDKIRDQLNTIHGVFN
jgi:hypothetical protein